MGYGNCAVVNDTPENREVAGEAALWFQAGEPASLAAALNWVLSHPAEARQLGEAAARRAASRFSWEAVADRYAALLEGLAGREMNYDELA